MATWKLALMACVVVLPGGSLVLLAYALYRSLVLRERSLPRPRAEPRALRAPHAGVAQS